MNSKHREERRNAIKEVKKSRIDRKTLERFSKNQREKKKIEKRRKNVYSTLTRREITLKIKSDEI